jgi:hypothetical protein
VILWSLIIIMPLLHTHLSTPPWAVWQPRLCKNRHNNLKKWQLNGGSWKPSAH